MPRQLRENSLTDEIIIPPTLPIHIVLARNLITLVHPLPTAQSTRGNFVIAVTGRPLHLVFGIKLVDLFKNPTTPVGVIGWFSGGAMNLAKPIQYLV